MKNKITKMLISIMFLLIISVGYATWILTGINKNFNSINHTLSDNDTVDINVHYRTQTSETSTTTEYFIPKTFTISHNLTYEDINGNRSYDKLSSSGDITVSNSDDLLVYYDVNDGKYTKINQRNMNVGPEQIKSFTVDVTEWESVEDSTKYANVWDVTVDHPEKNDYRLRFEEDSGNALTGHGHKYNIGDVYKQDEIISSITEEIGNSIITTTIYQRIIVDKLEDITYGSTGSGCTKVYYKKWMFYGTFQQRMIRITQTTSEPVDSDTINTISIKKGSKLSAIDLGITDYVNYGYYADENYETYFDFNTPISSETDIYLRFISNSEGLADTINNTTTSGTSLTLYDQYLGGSAGTTDVSLDASYHNPTNSVFANSFTINSGVSVNLTFSNALSYVSPIEGMIASDSIGAHRTSTDNSIAEDYDGSNYIGDTNKSIHFILNGDVTVKGSLIIGAEIGSHTGNVYYSMIIGKYAVLDLYGHTITVDGGSIKAYGIIKDSIGGGKIIVKNGGNITGTMTVSDGRGRDPSALGISKRQTPFSEYKLSYLRVPIYLYNGTSLDGYLKADFAQFGATNLTLPFLGNTFNSYLFSWDSSNNSDDYVLYEPYQLEQLSTQENTVIYKSMYNWRNRFIFNANIREASELILEATVDSVAGEVNIAIDFARIDVPISPFFDLIIKNGYSMELNSKLTMYPGSYFYAEKNSTIYFNFAGNKKYEQISKTLGNVGITIPGETRYIAGGIMTYTNNIQSLATNSYSTFNIGLYNAPTYWNYVKQSVAIIDGNISFNQGIDTSKSDGFYYLSGNIQLSDRALVSLVDNKNYIKTYDFKSELKTIFLYNNNNYSVEKQYALATSYNINPLISGSNAYIIDKDHNMCGTYNINIGVFTNNDDKMYFLKTDNDMYEDGSSGSYQTSRIDRAISIVEVSYTYETYKIIKDVSGNPYLYYCGLLVPILSILPDTISFSNNAEININARKFMSNSEADFNASIKTITTNADGTTTTSSSVSTNVADCFSNLTVRYSTSTKQWKYYCYGKYPKTDTGTGTRYSY